MRRKLPIVRVGDRVSRLVKRGRPGGGSLGVVTEILTDRLGRPACRVVAGSVSTVWALKRIRVEKESE